jgi:hypothetical protein
MHAYRVEIAFTRLTDDEPLVRLAHTEKAATFLEAWPKLSEGLSAKVERITEQLPLIELDETNSTKENQA